MLKLTSLDYDGRLRAFCVNGRCDYNWFLSTTKGAEHNLEIQRGIIKGSKAYATLRADLKKGCILPPVVLAVKNLALPQALATQEGPIVDAQQEQSIVAEITPGIRDVVPDNIYIIDGLQRTNAIKQTAEELMDVEKAAFLTNQLRIEMWLNIPFGSLAYRMLLLNAGQRPMSIKYQVEILSMKLREELATIPGIQILTALAGKRRTQAGQFHLSILSQAFQAWLQGQPNLDLRNLVMEQLLAESAIETLGASLTGQRTPVERDAYKTFIEWVVKVDKLLPESTPEFFANETVLLGFAAAVGAAERNTVLQERMRIVLADLLQKVQTEANGDPLGISEFDRLRKGIDPQKVNVGTATRDMVFKAFQECFVAAGTKPMPACWQFAAGGV